MKTLILRVFVNENRHWIEFCPCKSIVFVLTPSYACITNFLFFVLFISWFTIKTTKMLKQWKTKMKSVMFYCISIRLTLDKDSQFEKKKIFFPASQHRDMIQKCKKSALFGNMNQCSDKLHFRNKIGKSKIYPSFSVILLIDFYVIDHFHSMWKKIIIKKIFCIL